MEIQLSDPIPQPGISCEVDRRSLTDRRQTSTAPWGSLPPAGRRVGCRRADERRRPHFVDRFSPAMLAILLMFILASLLDALFTMQLLHAGANEINPLMARLLDYGVLPFVLGKYALTVAGLPVLLVLKNQRLLSTRFRVGYLIPLVVVLYALLICYQLVLLWKGWAPCPT